LVDFCNEGGAEFSAYVACRYIYGDEFAMALKDNYLSQISKPHGTTSIVDTKSTSPDRELNHYIKTAIMFINAEQQFGEIRVFGLLKAVYNKYASTRNATTSAFLELCEPEMKDFFEKYLFANGWSEINYISNK
jgi:hypothetical protein